MPMGYMIGNGCVNPVGDTEDINSSETRLMPTLMAPLVLVIQPRYQSQDYIQDIQAR